MKRLLVVIATILAVGLLATAYMCHAARRDPAIRRAEVPMLAPGTEPLTVLIVGDIHVAGPDMTPQRLRRLVTRMNSLDADIVLIAGDFTSDKRTATETYETAAAVAPLKSLTAAQGVFAVPGNHDHWRDIAQLESALDDSGIELLRNENREVGPVSIVGIDDDFSGHADLDAALSHVPAGPVLVVTHSPDIIPELPPEVRFVAAGHTHCGQIRLPLIGAVSYMSDYGDRFACGHIVEGERHIFVTAGLGTSLLPLRLGAVPDLWLVTLTAKPS